MNASARADAVLEVGVHLVDVRSVTSELGRSEGVGNVLGAGTGVEGVESDVEAVEEGAEEGRAERGDSNAAKEVGLVEEGKVSSQNERSGHS